MDGHVLAQRLRDFGVRGQLVTMAEAGQLFDLRCEMPTCYCPEGRKHFVKKAQPMPEWAPNVDHSPLMRMLGGERGPDNVRLAHVVCNNRDIGFQRLVGKRLAEHDSLSEIADRLNHRNIRLPHGQKNWTPRLVRDVYTK